MQESSYESYLFIKKNDERKWKSKKDLCMFFINLEKIMIGSLGRLCGGFSEKKCLMDILIIKDTYYEVTQVRVIEGETTFSYHIKFMPRINFKP